MFTMWISIPGKMVSYQDRPSWFMLRDLFAWHARCWWSEVCSSYIWVSSTELLCSTLWFFVELVYIDYIDCHHSLLCYVKSIPNCPSHLPKQHGQIANTIGSTSIRYFRVDISSMSIRGYLPSWRFALRLFLTHALTIKYVYIRNPFQGNMPEYFFVCWIDMNATTSGMMGTTGTAAPPAPPGTGTMGTTMANTGKIRLRMRRRCACIRACVMAI